MSGVITNLGVRLFLSYSPGDTAELADRLEQDLSLSGYEVWRDSRHIRPGQAWEAEIGDALRNSQVVVALLSPRAVRRRGDSASTDAADSVCLDELSFARFACRNPIVPVMAIPCEPPFLIFRLQYVDLCDWRGSEGRYRAGLTRLMEAIDAGIRGEVRYRSWEDRLRPWDFAAFLNEKRHDFCGRQWLFNEIDDWRASSLERALLILGDPGAGKSAFVAELADRNPGGQVLAYHCCQADTRETLHPGRFVRSLAAMIASQLDDYAVQLSVPAVEEALSEASCNGDPASAFEAGILTPLEALKAPDEGVRYLLIDALDEALLLGTGSARGTLLDLLASRLDRFPAWLRLVATSRKERAVLGRLSGLRARELEAHDPRNLEDIDRYTTTRLASPILAERLKRSPLSLHDAARILRDKGGGNFLYVQQALQGVERDVHGFDRLEDLPPGLSGLYLRFFERQFPDESRYAPARRLLEVVLAAQEHLNDEQLARATGFDIKNELPSALRTLDAYLHRRDGRYALYHKSLADWLTGDRPDEYQVSAQRGHERLADLCMTEYRKGPDAMSLYALANLPTHLVLSGRSDVLATLVTEKAFLQEAAARQGPVVAMKHARTIATALADAGDCHWAELLACADAYCRFGEAIRNSPLILEDLIDRGQINEARDIINKQPDEFLRGVLMVAAGPLADKAGQPAAASEMQAEGARVVRAKIQARVDVGEWYTPETKELTELLLSYVPHVLNLCPINDDEIGRMLKNDARGPGAPRRTRLPLMWRALAHVSSVRMRFYTAKSMWIAFGLMIYFVAYHVTTKQGVIREFPPWFLVTIPLLIAWTFVGQTVIGAADNALRRMSDRFDRSLRRVAIAIERRPEIERQRHYARLLHFFCLTRSAPMPPSSETLLAYWTVRRLDGLLDQPEQMADLVIDASLMFQSTWDSLVRRMAALSPASAQQVYASLMRRALTPADYGRLLYMAVEGSERTGDVDFLVACLERYRRLIDDDLKKESAAQKSKLLYCVSQISLGRAVLASMQRFPVSADTWIREHLVLFVCRFPFMEHARSVVRSPFELALAMMLITPYMFFMYLLLLLAAVLFILPLFLLMLAAGAPFDPYALAAQCRGNSPTETRRILARSLLGTDFSWDFWRLRTRMTSGWILAPAAIRYVRRTVIAQNILRDERVEIAASGRALERVVSWFIRQGLYGPPAQVVLKVMDDRRLLAACHELAPTKTHPRREAPGPDRDREQLERVLPPRSLVLSIVTRIVLSGAVTLGWLGVSARLFPNDLETWLYPYAAFASVVGCVFLVIAQHVYPALHIDRLVRWLIEAGSRVWQHLRRVMRREPGQIVHAEDIKVATVAVWYQIALGLLSIVVLYRIAAAAHDAALDVGLPYPLEQSDTPFLFVAVTAILAAKVLVPSLVASWRGSRLLYPTAPRIWLERVLCLPQIAIGALVLALLAHWHIAGGATSKTMSAVLLKKGNDSYARADFPRAIQQLTEAIRFNPGNADAFRNRALVHERLHDYERAIADFSSVIRLQPTNLDVWNSRGWARAISGKLADALDDSNKSLELRSGDANTLDSRGLIYLKMGELTRAIADYDAALRIRPQTAQSLFGRGIAKLRKGNQPGGNADIAAAKAIRTDIAEEFAGYGVHQ